MKRIIYFLCFVILLSSCTYKKELKKAESMQERINYSEGLNVCKMKIDEVMNIYICTSRKKCHLWNAGYSQQSQYLRYLHFIHNYYTWEQFIQKEIDIYEQWFSSNPEDKEHLFYYGILLLNTGREKDGIKILSENYNPEYKYTYKNPVSTKESQNFFSGLLLGKLSKENFKGTMYEEFFDYSLEDIIGIIAE